MTTAQRKLRLLSDALFNLSQQVDELCEADATSHVHMTDDDVQRFANDDMMPQLQATLSTLRV